MRAQPKDDTMPGKVVKHRPLPQSSEVIALEQRFNALLNVKSEKMFQEAVTEIHRSPSDLSPETRARLIGVAKTTLLNKMIVYLNSI